MKRFMIKDTEYAWHDGYLYVVSDNGDTLLPPFVGTFTGLEACEESDAEEVAEVWESQK